MAFEVYPAVDIRGGKCVRLYQGDYDLEFCYFENPLEAAMLWQAEGAEWLHIIDLDGARSGKTENIEIIKRIVEETGLKIQVGGGIRNLETIRNYLQAGVERVILGSAALADIDFVKAAVKEFGWKSLVVSLDAKEGKVYSQGWLSAEGEGVEEAGKRLSAAGIELFIYTNISKDGTLSGPDSEGALRLSRETGKRVIVAGGIGSERDVLMLAEYEQEGIAGAIVGRAIYTGDVKLKRLLANLGVKAYVGEENNTLFGCQRRQGSEGY